MHAWWIETISLLAGALTGFAIAHASVAAVRRILHRTRGSLENAFLDRLRGPVAAILLIAGAAVADTFAGVHLNGRTGGLVVHVFSIAFVVAGAWLAFRFTYVFEDAMLIRLRMDRADNLRVRRIQTQIQVFRKVSAAGIIVLATAIVLLSFGSVRAAGTGLLASAGIVAVIAGVAAKPAMTNLLAGIQIAITQPIRVDDVVVVDGHWGRIEEINLTYLVIRVWDLRRLVVPISYLITTPFENWTRTNSEILGFVHLDVDYTAPVGAIREHFEAILRNSPNWDGTVARLQVVSVGTSTMQLRALMSSVDSPTSWDLQCEVREALVAYLRDEYPDALPRLRLGRSEPSNGSPDGSPDGPVRTDDAVIGPEAFATAHRADPSDGNKVN